MRTFKEYIAEATDVNGNEYDPKESTGTLGHFQIILENLKEAQTMLENIINRKGYNQNEVIAIRKILLNTVRNNLDNTIGHMPDKRHY